MSLDPIGVDAPQHSSTVRCLPSTSKPVAFVSQHQTQILLNRIALQLLSADAWEYVARELLADIGKHLPVDRIQVLRYNNAAQVSLFHWACDHAHLPAAWPAIDLPVVVDETSRWHQVNPSVVHSTSRHLQQADTVHDPVQAYLNCTAAKSVIVCPLKINNTTWGQLVFQCSQYASLDQHAAFLATQISFQTIAELLNAAIQGGQKVVQLKEVETRFQVVARATKDILYEWNVAQKTIWRSPSIQIMLGYTPKEVQNNLHWWERQIHPKDRHRVANSLYQATQSKKGFWSAQYHLRHRTGRYVYVFDRAYLAYDGQGELIRMTGSTQDISLVKEKELELEKSRDQLRQLAVKAQDIREEERKHLSRELHDEFAQVLMGIKMNMQWLEQQIDPEQKAIHDCIQQTDKVIQRSMQKVKQIAMALRPDVLDDLGLVEAIQWQLDQLQQKSDLQCTLRLPKQTVKLSDETKIATFRIFQELLTNVTRHAKADSLSVELTHTPQNLQLIVKDNGIGIEHKTLTSARSLGLLGMQERAGAVNGNLIIQRGTRWSTEAVLTLPLHQTVCQKNFA